MREAMRPELPPSSPAQRGRWPAAKRTDGGGAERSPRRLRPCAPSTIAARRSPFPALRGRMNALFALLALLFAFPALAAPTFPPLTGRVVDDAHVLSPQTQADL